MQLTEKKLAELKDSANHILADHKRKILMKYPFVGNILMNMDVIPVRDNRCETAATDGRRIFFSIDFLRSLKPNEAEFVLAHEVGHCMMMHMTREQKREHQLANVAEDVEVNEILIADGFSMPKDGCCCRSLRLPAALSFEEYYELLLKKAQIYGGVGLPNAAAKNGSGTPSPSGQFDKHFHEGEDMSQVKGNQNATDKYGAVGHDADFQPKLEAQLKEKLRETIVSAAQSYERQRGELPGHLQSLVKKLLKPQIRWQEQLAEFISKTPSGGKNNWSVPNKRFVGRGLYLPSRTGESLKCGILLDTSGSCQQYPQKFLSEVNSIVKSFSSYEISVCQCDHEVQKFDSYTDENPLDLESQEFKSYGGGGTRMLHGLREFDLQGKEVDCIICFTDMKIEDLEPEDAPGVPVLWVSTTKGPHPNVKFGTEIEFDTAA